jgi:thiosulfate dehydrogenase (quinone) large subunit
MRSTLADTQGRNVVAITDPPFATSVLSGTRWAWLWLIVRLYVGYMWISAGLGKLGNPAWTQTGTALKGFWTNAVAVPAGGHSAPIAFDWYRAFIQALLASNAYVWFAKIVVAGELLVGIALILGLFTGLTAFIGGFMNWNFMMAGTASINPVLFTLSIFLILAWKIAGWWGLDRFLLPALGTPWRPGLIFGRGRSPNTPVEAEIPDRA